MVEDCGPASETMPWEGVSRWPTNDYFTEMCCGTEAGAYLRLIDSCITQLKAQGPSRTCNESKEEEKEEHLHPDQIVFFESPSLHHWSPDPGERQYRPRT